MKKIYLVGAMCAYLFAGCAGNASQAGHDEHNHELEAHDHSMKVRITIMIMRDMNTKAMTMSMRLVVPIPARLSLRKLSRGRWFADRNG